MYSSETLALIKDTDKEDREKALKAQCKDLHDPTNMGPLPDSQKCNPSWDEVQDP